MLRDRKGEGETFFHAARKAGFSRVRVNGTLYDLDDAPKLDKKKRHSIEVVVDRFIVRRPVDEKGKPLPPEDRSRLSDSVETALKLGEGLVIISSAAAEGSKPTFEERLFSEKLGCPYDGTVMDDLEPRSFSFNSPHGACPECTGLGFRLEVDPERVIDPEKSVLEGGLVPWSRSPEGSWYLKVVTAAMKAKKWNPKTPIGELPAAAQEYLLNAEREDRFTVTYENASYRNTYKAAFEGIIANLERRHRETDSELVRVEIERYMVSRPCPECKGRRLKPEMLAVRVAEKNIAEVAAMPIGELTRWINALTPLLGERERTIAKAIVKEIAERAGFLVDVGLDYLTVDRTATTLSGGEAQRIRLATQIGSRLVGVLYILDEPSIGLHQRDNARLITTLLRLRDLGNTVLVVEHDEETIRTADWIVDIGPGAGELGGKVVVNGTLKALTDAKESITGAFIRGDRAVKIPKTRRKGSGKSIVVKGARAGLAAREVAGVVLNPRAVPHLAHHLEVKGGSLPETRRLENLPGGLQLPAARLHLLLNVVNRFSEFLRWGHIVRCGVDHHLVPLGEDLTRERVHLCNALYFITEKLHAENRLFTRRLHLNGVPTHAELGAAEGGVIPLILQINEVTQDGISAVLPRFANTQDGCPVVNRCAEAVDATYGGHNDRVAPLKERLRCRMTQLVNLIIAT